MPHDHAPHPHGPHGHVHHPHDHDRPGAADHLHGHAQAEDAAADLQVLAAQFVGGFLQAKDKTSYLRLAGVPVGRPGTAGAKARKLVEVELKTEWQVGAAAPSFGSRELSYLPFPGGMVRARTNMALVYVSMDEGSVLDLRDVLATRKAEVER